MSVSSSLRAFFSKMKLAAVFIACAVNATISLRVLVLGFLLVGLLGPFDPDAPCVFGDFAASDIVSVVVFLG